MFLNKNDFEQELIYLCTLFKVCFNKKLEKNFLIWRYKENPMDELLMNIEKEGMDIISNYSASPVQLNGSDGSMKGGLSMTTMTHPKFSGKGLFQKLANELYNRMKDIDYKLVFGFPNNNSYRVFVTKLNWKNIYEIPTLKLKLDRVKDRDNIIPKFDDSFNLDYSNIGRPFEGYSMINRSSEYLRWRYLKNPTNNYNNLVIASGQKVTSYMVYKTYCEKDIDIVDFMPANKEEAEFLIRAIIGIARENNFEYINTWSSVFTYIYCIFTKYGFVNHEPITYFGANIFSDGKLANQLTSYANWYIQMGDSDVY